MASGYRSMLAFWMGGAGMASSVPTGYRSMLAFWMGGAGLGGTATGCRSLLAFWMGGGSMEEISVFLRPTKFTGPVL